MRFCLRASEEIPTDNFSRGTVLLAIATGDLDRRKCLPSVNRRLLDHLFASRDHPVHSTVKRDFRPHQRDHRFCKTGEHTGQYKSLTLTNSSKVIIICISYKLPVTSGACFAQFTR